MTEPAPFDRETTPYVTLGGKDWPVPPLAIRQLRNVWEQTMSITRLLDAAGLENKAGDGQAQALGDCIISLTNEQFGKLLHVVHQGLTRAHPDLTREEFDEIAMTPFEALIAFLIVRRQIIAPMEYSKVAANG